MVFNIKGVPSLAVQFFLPPGKSVFHFFQIKFGLQIIHQDTIRIHMLKMEHEIQFSVFPAYVFQRVSRRHHRRLANGKAVILIRNLPVFTQILVNMRAVHIMLYAARGGDRKAVWQTFFFGDKGNHVFPETIHTQIKPETEDILDFPAHVRVIVIQIRLLFGKYMQVVFIDIFFIFPSAALKAGEPVVGRTFPPALTPEIIIMIRRGGIFGLSEPFMFIRSVVHNQIHNHFHAARMRLIQHLLKQIHISVFRADIAVISNIIAEIGVRRRIERRKPDAVDAEAFQIIHFAEHALQIADAVSVAVTKRTRPDLIHNKIFKPVFHKIHPLR